MIPNSQLVVVPYPLDDPSRFVPTKFFCLNMSISSNFRWLIKLFITPSRMILHTGIALGVTLVVLAGVLAVFQYREKVCLFVIFFSGE